jgi:O-antigen/teichoic acid export membrane protein
MNLAEELSTKRSYLGILEGFGGGFLALVLSVSLARVMTLQSFGELSSARGLLWIAEVLASLGMGSLATRIYRAKQSDSNEIRARGLRRGAPLLIILVSATFFVVLVGFHDAIGSQSAVQMLSFIAVLAILPLACLLTFFTASAAAHGAGVAASAISQWGIRILFLVTLGFFLLQFERPLTVIQAAAVWAIATALCVLALWILVLRVEPKYLHHGGREYEIPNWLRVGLAFALASFGTKVIRSGGVVVLGWIHADASAAGRLTAAIAISTLLLTATGSLQMIYRPVLVGAIERKNLAGVQEVFRLWRRRVFSVLVPACLATIVFAPSLLEFFGRGYADAYWALVICAIGNISFSFLALGIPLYQFTGHERNTVILMSILAALCVGGMVVLGSIWAETGVALATAFTLNIGALLVSILGWRATRSWQTTAPPEVPVMQNE